MGLVWHRMGCVWDVKVKESRSYCLLKYNKEALARMSSFRRGRARNSICLGLTAYGNGVMSSKG